MKYQTFNRISIIFFSLVIIAGFIALAFYGDIDRKSVV